MVPLHPNTLLPTSPLGRAALWLVGAHVILMLSWRLLGPLGAFPGLLVGLAASLTAVASIVRRGDRGILVWAATLPGVLVVLFVAVELLVGHS